MTRRRTPTLEVREALLPADALAAVRRLPDAGMNLEGHAGS